MHNYAVDTITFFLLCLPKAVNKTHCVEKDFGVQRKALTHIQTMRIAKQVLVYHIAHDIVQYGLRKWDKKLTSVP